MISRYLLRETHSSGMGSLSLGIIAGDLMGRTFKRFCHCGRKAVADTFLCKLHGADPKLEVAATDVRISQPPNLRNAPNPQGAILKKLISPIRRKQKSKRKKARKAILKGTEHKNTPLSRYAESVARARKLGVHFVQGGRIDSNRAKH
jgi:hypothetical protein